VSRPLNAVRVRVAALALLGLGLLPAQAVSVKLRPQSPQIETIIVDLLKRLSSSTLPLTLDKSSGTVFVLSDTVTATAAPVTVPASSAAVGTVTSPASGLPATGAPITGAPVTGLPATGVPLTGLPVTGLPANGLTPLAPGVSPVTGTPSSDVLTASGVAFNPDVSSRTLTGLGGKRVEFNQRGPVSLKEAVETEVQKELGLSALTPEAAQLRFSGADLNGDGKIDTDDLALLMGNFGQSAGNLRGDLNNDGRVDDLDVQLFSAQYRLP